MSNLLLAKSQIAAMAIPPFRIVKPSAAETVTLATGPTDALMGINGDVAPATGERCDIWKVGISYVEAGAAVAHGAPITSDATGRGVTAAPATGVNNRVIAFAEEAATAAGDVIRVLLSPCVIQG